MNGFAEGYDYFKRNAGAFAGAEIGNEYVADIDKEIKKFADLLNNEFKGMNTPTDKLKGNVAEFWHSGTFNINAVVNGSNDHANVLKSHELGSADIELKSGVAAQSKYYKTPEATMKQQAKTVQERYHEYRGDQSLEEYTVNNHYNSPDDPLYSGQVRIVPKEQLEEIKTLLNKRIAKERVIRPENAERYEETLRMLSDKLENAEGVGSVPLSTEDAEMLTRLAKEGLITEDELRKLGISAEELVHFEHIMKEAFKSGLSAAMISMLLKTAPEIYCALEYLIKNGELDTDQFKKIGFAALTGAGEGFIRGTVASALTTACKTNMFGETLQGLTPSVIGAITVITMNTMKNSFYVVKGTMTRQKLVNNMIKEMFVTTCSLALGTLTQGIVEIPVFGFMIGSFIGSVAGSFAYHSGYNAVLSFCVDTGFAMFGLVEQNYELPDEVFECIGAEVFEFEKFSFDEFKYEEFSFNEFSSETFAPEGLSISLLNRGVIGVSRIGYV